MLDLVTYDKLRELQRFAELGRLSASLLHEISNPLAAALLNLELGDQKSRSIRRARRDMQLLWRYVEAARQQVRQQSKPTSFWVQPPLCQLKRVVVPLARKAGVRLNIQAAPSCRLYGDPVKFQQLVTNLITNAIEAYDPSHNRRQTSLVKVTLTAGDNWLTIQVIDWGKGIDTEALEHIFDNFYTTKDQSGYGLGVGLAIVKRYVTADFGGFIKVGSSSLGGTRFTVKLPVV
jgi:signal transduction histidine kinase